MFYYEVDERIRLILPERRHAAEIYALVRENLDILKPWMPWATDDYSLDSAHAYIEANLKELAETGSFAASIALDGRIVGQIGFHKLNMVNRSAHIGYWLAAPAHGQGVVTRCCRALVDYLFDCLELNRVQINCNVENAKSRAVPERLGFSLEGIHRQVEFHRGKFGDWAVYAMLKEDWRK